MADSPTGDEVDEEPLMGVGRTLCSAGQDVVHLAKAEASRTDRYRADDDARCMLKQSLVLVHRVDHGCRRVASPA